MILPSQEIAYRSDFSLLCNARGLVGNAVEIGTDRGEFAADFLDRWHGKQLICVDPYKRYAEMDRPRECDRLMAVSALQRFWPRARFYELDSIAASLSLMPWERPADFIYIDGAHDYESVKADVAAWLPVLSPIGIIAGHDYDEEHPGVMHAVNEIAVDRQVYLTSERLASWYFYAEEPETLVQRFFQKRDIPNPNLPSATDAT